MHLCSTLQSRPLIVSDLPTICSIISDLPICIWESTYMEPTTLCTSLRVTNGRLLFIPDMYSSYKFQVMHYSLTNTLASFQHFMDNVFKDLLDKCVVIYLGDILIYSDNPNEHVKQINEVLDHLIKHILFAKIEKCEFVIDTIEFLGFVINPNGIHMDESKAKVIQDWPVPWCVKDVQSFLEFTNFYWWFIVNFSAMTVPLTCLTCKDMSWNWTDACQEVFTLLKQAFTTVLCLWHFDPALHLIICSNYTITGIISFCDDKGEVKPVAFMIHSTVPSLITTPMMRSFWLSLRPQDGWTRGYCHFL